MRFQSVAFFRGLRGGSVGHFLENAPSLIAFLRSRPPQPLFPPEAAEFFPFDALTIQTSRLVNPRAANATFMRFNLSSGQMVSNHVDDPRRVSRSVLDSNALIETQKIATVGFVPTHSALGVCLPRER